MNKKQINILIACEESQVECKAFRELGFHAFSCDIQKCAGGHPEWHIQGDVTRYLQGDTTFTTMDGKRHTVTRWHMIIAHPPCTYLCRVSSVCLVKNGIVDAARWQKAQEARAFFQKCLDSKADYVAVENPIPMKRVQLPRPSFYTCPSQFGHKYTKKTLWWTKNLPPVLPRLFYPNPKEFVRASRGKYRSRTFTGVAKAMAETWGQLLVEEYIKKKCTGKTTTKHP